MSLAIAIMLKHFMHSWKLQTVSDGSQALPVEVSEPLYVETTATENLIVDKTNLLAVIVKYVLLQYISTKAVSWHH